MAIAAIVLHTAESPRELEKSLRAFPWIVDVKFAPPDKLAVALDSPANELMGNMQIAANLPGVWNLELVCVNYEDDLESGEDMNCPPIAEIWKKIKK